MNETTFITLLDWMVDKLHLSGNELVIYGIIHGFSQDGHSVYYGSISYLAKKSGISDRSVLTVLQKLVAKKLIIKEDVKEYTVTSNDGKQELKKAQGGANHFCIYYTKVSRLHNYCEVIPAVYQKNPILKPTEDSSHGNIAPTEVSSHGIKTPTEVSSYGNDVPTEDSSHGKTPPTEDISYATSEVSSYAATEDSSYNNKLYSKEETTTSAEIWNKQICDYVLDNIFGSCSLFQSSFKNSLIIFLNNKKMTIVEATDYLNWGIETAKSKATKDFLGYFISTILLDSFYSQFKFVNKVEENKEVENKLHCPICDSYFDKFLTECPNCHNDVSDFGNEKLVSFKKKIWLLPKAQREKLEDEVREIGNSIFSIAGLHTKEVISKEDITQRQMAVYRKYGIC